MSRIITRTIEEENKELIAKAAEEMSRKSEESLRKILEESKSDIVPGRSKVSQILANASKGTTSSQTDDKDKDNEIEKEKKELEEIKKKERMEFDKEKERLQKELEEEAVFCPTCSGKKHEHKHALKKTEKGTLKCVDGTCKIEYALVPTDANYKCTTCNIPKRKPIEENSDDSCPFCGSKEFEKFDWSKIINKNKKNK